MRKIVAIIMTILGLSSFAAAQETRPDLGSVQLHFGTIAVYSTYSLAYESPDVLARVEGHELRAYAGVGGWRASLFGKNNGVQSSVGLTYLLGKGDHFFEHQSGLMIHLDKGLKGQGLTYIGSLYRPFFGYRYAPREEKILLKIGVGFREVVQMGIGWRF